MNPYLLASAILQDNNTIDTGFPWFFFIVMMAVAVMMIVATWILYEKAGEPGIGMALLPWIFIPILAFSDAQPVSDPRRQ